MMTYVIPLILIALAQYLFFVFRAGFTRAKYGVDAPKISGNDTWERILRVQLNTLEQLIVFIPGVLFFLFLSPWLRGEGF
jgi:glutathione S-transferase